MKKPSSICPDQLRSIGSHKLNPVKIENQEMLKGIVTDYVVRSFSSTSQRLQKQKYETLPVEVEVNGQNQRFEFNLFAIVEKYVTVSKSVSQGSQGIEMVVANILEFISKFDDKVSLLKVTLVGNVSKETVLLEMISDFIQNKQKEQLEKQYHQAKEKMYPKYRKVLIKDPKDKHKRTCDLLCEQDEDNSHRRSHRISRNSIDSKDEDEELYKKYLPTPAASKLKELVDSCNIFHHSQKLQALRQQKIIAQYCKDEFDYQQCIEKVEGERRSEEGSSLDPVTARLLGEWVKEMSVSEYLFNRKFGLEKERQVERTSFMESSSEDE